MPLGPYEIAFIGVGGIIVGVLVGAWVGYRLPLSLSHITAEQNAGMHPREAFKSELLALVPSQHALSEDIPIFLERSFQKHREAVFDFAFYLKSDEKQKLYEAWYTYYCPEKNRSETSVPYLEKYSCMELNTAQNHEVKKKVRDKLQTKGILRRVGGKRAGRWEAVEDRE